jgi:hypothetical protein
VLAQRLARVVDRSRQLEAEAPGGSDAGRAAYAAELGLLERRMTVVNWAISLCTASAFRPSCTRRRRCSCRRRRSCRRSRRRSAAASAGRSLWRWCFPRVALQPCVRTARSETGQHIDGEGQRFELNLDRFDGLGRGVFIDGGHRENRLALVHWLVCQRPLALCGRDNAFAE